jgi:hypothetical protein
VLLTQLERKGNSVTIGKEQVDGYAAVVPFPHQFGRLFGSGGAIDLDTGSVEPLSQWFESPCVRGAQ